MEAADIVGYRFNPSDQELVSHHLKRRLLGIQAKKCLIPTLNIYDHQPWDLHRIYNEKSDIKCCGKKCFFFCPRNNGGGGRTSRKAGGGFWKDTSRKRSIKLGGKTVGMKKILVFYEGKQKNSRKTEWVMHEYHLNALDEGAAVDDLGAFALCCVKRKPMNKEKAPASACETNLSSPSTAIVEVEEPNQEVSGQLQIENAVSDTNEFNVDELLQYIGYDDDEETSPAMTHDCIPLFQHQPTDAATATATASSGVLQDIDNSLMWFQQQMDEILPTDAATASSGILQDMDSSLMWLSEFAETDGFNELLWTQ